MGGLEGFAGRARPSDDSSHPDTSSVRAHRPVAAPSLRHGGEEGHLVYDKRGLLDVKGQNLVCMELISEIKRKLN